ncbi:aminotransferase class I/II-fold pyridoxal phosphate-dependent enzyme [Micromonospora sp. NPDC051925]|uniref:aminotransferase class I/II-fold pyridoxal phosphate-dependent enzyme n=1 Tax=Micromonospora sp. NPDC051925 TaxID=3364288 RepID=UPI0037C8E3C6
MTGIRNIMGDIASATADGGRWLNLSPGNPAAIPEAVKVWRRLAEQSLADTFEASTRYGPSRGTTGLVDAIVRHFRACYGWDLGPDNVAVAAGAQLLAFMTTTIFTGTTSSGRRPLVLPCTPDYTGYHGLSLVPGGIVGIEPSVELLDDRYFRYQLNPEALHRQQEMGMMLVSNPANPSGRGLTSAELDLLVEVATERDVPLVVDNAYGEPFPRVAESPSGLRFHPHVLNLFTASKAGIPGERIAFAIGPPEIIDAVVAFTANVSLHPPQLVQSVLERSLADGELDTLSREVLRPYYLRKRKTAEALLARHLPADVNWRLHASDGGMFCWLWIDHPGFDDLAFYETMKRNNVFIVPGRHFFVAPLTSPFLSTHGTRCIRLSLSPELPVLEEGISRVGRLLGEFGSER